MLNPSSKHVLVGQTYREPDPHTPYSRRWRRDACAAPHQQPAERGAAGRGHAPRGHGGRRPSAVQGTVRGTPGPDQVAAVAVSKGVSVVQGWQYNLESEVTIGYIT